MKNNFLKFFILLAACLLAAVFCSGLTVKLGTGESSSKLLKLETKKITVSEVKKVTSIKVNWLGHAAFLITAQFESNIAGTSEVKILAEPYEPNTFYLKYKPIEYEADIVTLSNEEHSEKILGSLRGSPEAFISQVGRFQTKGITIEGVQSFRDAYGGKHRGVNAIYVFDIGGIRICHLGKVGHAMTKYGLAKIGRVDVLLVPVGGVNTIGPEVASEVVNQLYPKIVIPMHYKTDACELAIGGVSGFLNGKQNVKWTKDSEIEVKELPEDQEIIVLNYEH